VTVHMPSSACRPGRSVLSYSCFFFMVPEIPWDLEIGLLCGNSLGVQMLVVISVM